MATARRGGGHDPFERAAGRVLRINRAMGFREVESSIEWQLTA